MPIVERKITAPSPILNNIPKIQSPQAQTVVVDTKYEPMRSLLQYVEGSVWKLTYFSQIVDKDNDLRGQDPGQSSIYQQYKKINDLEVKVSDSLSWDQDAVTKMFTAQGTAYVNSFLIANVGDMFCADVGDGREGVFEVTTSEKKSLLKEAVFQIGYRLVYFSGEEAERRADLEKKTVQTYFYHRDFLNHGQNPLIIRDVHHATETLSEVYREVIQNYFQWFFSREFSTVMVPGQDGIRVYDHFITTVLLNILETTDDPAIRHIRRMNVDDDNRLRQPQLYEALLRCDKSLLRLANKEMGLASTRSFAYDPMMMSIRYVGIHYIVYPSNPAQGIDDDFNRLAWAKATGFATLEREDATTAAGDLKNILYADEMEYAEQTRRLIRPVSFEGSYVLSQEFYNATPQQTVLELMVNQYIKREPIDAKALAALMSHYTSWGALERFYYLPICLMLIKNIIHSF